jgi:hypothetical protein
MAFRRGHLAQNTIDQMLSILEAVPYQWGAKKSLLIRFFT